MTKCDWCRVRFVQLYFGMSLAMVALSATAVPIFHRAKVYTAYEYMENRSDAKTRALASLIFPMDAFAGNHRHAVGIIAAVYYTEKERTAYRRIR
jgi:hypothetical protein